MKTSNHSSNINSMDEREIDRRFCVAVSWVQNKEIEFPIKPSGTQSLFFYGRYKQAVHGDNTAPKPSVFTPIRRYMWSAHEKNKGKSASQAKHEYVSEIEKLCETFDFKTLPPRLEGPADQFFTAFYGTPQHPFVHVLPNIKRSTEPTSPSSTSNSPSTSSSPAIPTSRLTSPTRSSIAPPKSPGLNEEKSPSSPVKSVSFAATTAKITPATTPSRSSIGSSSNGVSSPGTNVPASTRSSLSSSSSSRSSSLSPATDPNSGSQLSSEVKDKEAIAQRLLQLQNANQLKLQQLERQMANLKQTQQTPKQSHYATPARSSTTPNHGLLTPAPNGAATSFTTLDPSSPFAAAWTPTGLASRTPIPTYVNNGVAATSRASHLSHTPATPFQSWHTPYGLTTMTPIHTIHEATPPNSPPKMNGLNHSGSNTNTPNRPRPIDELNDSAASSSSTSSSASRRSLSPAASSSSTSSHPLAALASRHHAHSDHVDTVSAEMRQRLQLAEEQVARLSAQIAEAELVGPPSSAAAAAAAVELAASNSSVKSPSLQLVLSIEKSSVLDYALRTAKYVVPIGLTAWGSWKVYEEYQRRWKK